ncbi:MAG: zinc-finger domain-containing protein [Rhodospirillaceae bacterium]|nr:zinc-finger domain-containing protein [Rhodospirillaceae bacterium]MDH5771775.1 zinc-finger domain-containing protein [Rhodospirillaceae bacterium]
MSDKPAITVNDTTASCEGKGVTGGHPRVFIKLDAHTRSGECPYCGQVFKLDPNAKISATH